MGACTHHKGENDMHYVKTMFSKQFDKVFRVQYLEVSKDLWASRSVEEKWDGNLDYADSENPNGVNGVFLPDIKLPEKDELFGPDGSCKLDSDGAFASVLITKSEFDAVWKKALKGNDGM